jgi:pyruvate dehydrogenase E2 component (dihydrolipoamide acetyltransferase)
MPALGMAQETGTLIQWLKAPGDSVTRGEPLMEVETDKATVEIEAPATGILANVTAQPGDVVPVGQPIAVIVLPGEAAPDSRQASGYGGLGAAPAGSPVTSFQLPLTASPVAARMAAEHNLDLARIKPAGGRVEKQDILDYLAALSAHAAAPAATARPGDGASAAPAPARVRASPKARRLAAERGLPLATLPGTGPSGAVLAADVLAAANLPSPRGTEAGGEGDPPQPGAMPGGEGEIVFSRLWQRMAARVTQAWTTIPHFYLQREVHASALLAWRDETQARSALKVTVTDLLVKLVAAALRRHPRLNAVWQGQALGLSADINVGLAVAVEAGLIVPVIHRAGALGLGALAARRAELVAKAQAGKLAPADLEGGTFTLSNLGMYGVEAFNAIVVPPQVAILAVGAVTERVVPVSGQPAVRPMIALTLSCDHRAVDGARGAEFLRTLAELIEAPLRLLD